MSNLQEKWSDILKILKEKIPSTSYDTWVLSLEVSEFKDNKLYLLTPFSFTKTTLVMSYGTVITETLTEVFGELTTFEIIYDKTLEAKYNKEQKNITKQETSKISKSQINKATEMWSDCHLNTRFTFERFVVGGFNQFAYGIAKAVAEGTDKGRYNPLFIYGGSGLGKTHLMQAIGNFLLSKKKKKIKFVTSEEFLNDLMKNLSKGMDKEPFQKSAEKNKIMSQFRQKYRDIDVLLIDDIQYIAGKKRTEEEIFNIFNTLYQAGKQIVMTSDKPPAEIDGLEERLKTRFEGGILADIGTPDLETRMAILNRLIEEDNHEIDLKLDSIEFLASIYKNNIRELEGAYNRVYAYFSLNKTIEPNLENVKKSINYKENAKQINIDFILKTCADFYSVKKEDIIGSSRVANISKARKVVVYISKKIIKNCSWQSIGKSLNKKHSTVMYGYDEIEKALQINSDLQNEINTLFNIINQS